MVSSTKALIDADSSNCRMNLETLRSRSLIALFAGFVWLGGITSAVGDWEEEALLLLNTVSPNLNDLRSRSTGNERLGRYAEALAAMNRNGIIPANPKAAEKIFRELLDIRSDDAIGLASRYYMIRIEQELAPEFDARESYRSLFQTYPDTFFGGLSLVKYAMLETYVNSDKADALRRLIVLEQLGQDLQIPDVRRDFNRVLGEAYLNFELSGEKAYEHLKDAADIGSTIPEAQADLLIKTGELAEQLGRLNDAVDLYARFCEEMEHDSRKAEIELRLSRLKNAP